MRVAFVGLGGVSESHFLGALSAPDIDVVAGMDVNAERADLIAHRHGIAAYTDHNKMYDLEEPDLVCVLTPAGYHLAPCLDALSRDIHVLCEKPLAVSLEDAKLIKTACENSAGKFFYGSVYRFLPTIVEARKIVQNGEIGDVRLVVESIIGGRGLASADILSPSHYPAGTLGGTPMGMVDHGIHLLDIIPWIMGTHQLTAHGRINTSGAALNAEYAIVSYENGAVAHLIYDDEGTFPTNPPHHGVFNQHYPGWADQGTGKSGQYDEDPRYIDVYGTAGALRIYYYANLLYRSSANGVEQIKIDELAAPFHFGRQLENCRRIILANEQPDPGVDVGLAALQSLHSIGSETPILASTDADS